MSRDAREWDERYAAAGAGGTVWPASPNRALVEALGTELAGVRPGTAVDVAAGEGRHALWLARRGWRVDAVDFSAVGLRRAEEAAAAAGVRIGTVVADVTGWDPGAPVDLVLCAYLHLPSPTMRPLLRRLAGWVAPGGRLVLLGHDRRNLDEGVGGPPDPDVLWTADALADVASAAGLTLTQSRQVLRAVDGAPRPAIDVLLVAVRPQPAGG